MVLRNSFYDLDKTRSAAIPQRSIRRISLGDDVMLLVERKEILRFSENGGVEPDLIDHGFDMGVFHDLLELFDRETKVVSRD